MSAADLELDNVKLASADEVVHLASLQDAAQSAAEQRARLASEVESISQVREAGKATLDELHEGHNERMRGLQEQLEAIEARAKASQQITTIAKQNIVRRQEERRE